MGGDDECPEQMRIEASGNPSGDTSIVSAGRHERFIESNAAARESAQSFIQDQGRERARIRQNAGISAEQMKEWMREHEDTMRVNAAVPRQEPLSGNIRGAREPAAP